MRQKTSDLRQIFSTAILHVRSGRATSRTMLARLMGISASTIGTYVDQMMTTGHLDESGVEKGGMGRPKRRLEVRSLPGWFAGVEFNAERIQFTGVDFSGSALPSRSVHLPPQPAAAEVEVALVQGLAELAAGHSRPLLGIGVGAPGLVDPHSGTSLHYAFIRGWENVPLRDLLTRRFQVPVVVENNLRVIALAERWFGSHRGEENFVVVGARCGFGVASMQAGRLLHGGSHAAGEIGRWPWPLHADESTGEVGTLLSAPATYRRLAGLDENAPVPQDLYTAMLSLVDDPCTRWEPVVKDFARVLGCVQHLLDPKLCLLHGPLTVLGSRFCEAVMDTFGEKNPPPQATVMNLVCSCLGDEAGALGAASLAMEAWQPTQF